MQMAWKAVRTGAACLAVALLASVWGDGVVHGQGTVVSISTNKFDYLGTQDVLISGSGFNSGENVTLAITQIGGGSVGSGPAAVGATFTDLAWNPPDNLRGTFLLTATGDISHKSARAIFTIGLQVVPDDAGPDDLSGQKDLNFLTIDYGNPGSSTVITTWGWDDTAWSGNNTGDACTLFDVSSDGDADYALCVTVGGSPAAYLSTRMYRCGPSPLFLGARSDRCTQPTLVTTPITSSGALTTPDHNADPFGNPVSSVFAASHTQGNKCSAKSGTAPCVTDDVVAALIVQLNDINNQAAKLINVCSYPSQEPNSDPSDCVITPNSGFLTIVKKSSPTTGTFTFNTSTNAIGSGSTFTFATSVDFGGSVFRGDRQFLTFPAGTLDYVRETVPAGWSLTSAACVIQTGGQGTPTGTPDTGTGTDPKGVASVELREGLETVCTFEDARDNPGLTLTKSVIDSWPGAALATAWTLTATNTTTDVSKTFTTGVADQIAPGTYRLAESGGPPTGYTAGKWDCSPHQLGGANNDELTIASGETVSCSITNTAQPATLIVKKTVVNDAGGSKHATDFSVKLNGSATNYTFLQDDAFGGDVDKGVYTFNGLAPGTYTVTENQVQGYDEPVMSNCANLDIPRGGSATCLITNNDKKNTPGGSTDQSVILHASVQFTGIIRNAPDALTGDNNKAVFRLYSDAGCSAQVNQDEKVLLNFANGSTTGTAATATGYTFNPGGATQSGVFYWKVTYTGDAYNSAYTTPCGPAPDGQKTTVTLDPH
jgi:hypothetical protein